MSGLAKKPFQRTRMLLSLAVAGAVFCGEVDLTPVFQPKETWVEKWSETTHGETESEFEIVHRKFTYTLVAQKGASIQVKGFREMTAHVLDGVVLPVPNAAKDPLGVETWERFGLRKAVLSNVEPYEYRLYRFGWYVTPEKPMEVGDSWTVKQPEDETRNIPTHSATYTFKGLVGTDRYKILVSTKEGEANSPATASGEIYLDRATNRPLSALIEIKNVRAPGNPAERHHITLRLEQ